jgi:hypothetical protein
MDWELCETGPEDAEHAVLLLPGGLTAARLYTEVMAEPALKTIPSRSAGLADCIIATPTGIA